jgi:hypothetical protein
MNQYAKLLEPVNNIPAGTVGKITQLNFAPLHQTITSTKIESAEMEFSLFDKIKGLTIVCEKVDYSKIRIVQVTAMQQLIDYINEKSQVVPIDIEYVLLKALELKKTEENHIKSAMGFLIRKNLDIFSYSDADEWFKDNFEN